ncbi:17-beta-hydroxysteroid dehydrogenase 13-like [Actinia tenebrosa]|uniref:Short-chain dehydrogenase/reductase 3 n=1 Tax=Actinia tenebrosa TaxID=6105 RepID=A0A6P8I0S1_ACTTE|nr:17-beta-hydroxysteroid dehydrogenase 13-like [Actinia tenebrosa]
MEIWVLYLILFVQAVLFILYFTGMWDVVMFFQVLLRVFLHVLWSFISCFLPAKRKSLRGQRALVTGAASGIGRLTAINLAKEGCKLVIWDVNTDGLKAVAEEIKALGAEVHYYVCDLCKREMIYEVADKVKKEVGDIDILMNNAGVVSGKKLLMCSDEEITRTFEVNALAHYWTIKSFLPHMLEKNQGHIVSTASVAGHFGLVRCVDYCGSKFAAVGLMDALRQEVYAMGKTGIHFTTICPSFISTGMFEGVKLKYPSLPGLQVLSPQSVADSIVDAVKRNKIMLLIPFLANVSLFAKGILPTKASDLLLHFLGADVAMDTFVGRQKKP